MKLTVANSKEFERLLDVLRDDVVGAAIHYRLHKDLRESVAHFERELNQSPAFWSLTFGAHIDATRSRLCLLREVRDGKITPKDQVHDGGVQGALEEPHTIARAVPHSGSACHLRRVASPGRAGPSEWRAT